MSESTGHNANLNPMEKERKSLPGPGLELYRRVRGAMIALGTTLNEWARENEIHPANVRSALYGYSDSEMARSIRQRVIEAAGLSE